MTEPSAASSLPLFYRKPVAVSAGQHGALSLVPVTDYGFARNTNSIPLAIAEFALAVRHYPIVFAATRPAIPVAIVGIDAAENLFLDVLGRWVDGVYLPAYVRRYPFLFIESADGAEFALAVDEAANALKIGGDTRLFEDGKPSAALERALAFCREYQSNVATSRAFADALEAEGLLVDRVATFELKSGRKVRLSGFRVVDEERFNALPDAAFLAFRKRGWLTPLYLHLVSTANWSGIIDLAARRGL
jgi:SapC